MVDLANEGVPLKSRLPVIAFLHQPSLYSLNESPSAYHSYSLPIQTFHVQPAGASSPCFFILPAFEELCPETDDTIEEAHDYTQQTSVQTMLSLDG